MECEIAEVDVGRRMRKTGSRRCCQRTSHTAALPPQYFCPFGRTWLCVLWLGVQSPVGSIGIAPGTGNAVASPGRHSSTDEIHPTKCSGHCAILRPDWWCADLRYRTGSRTLQRTPRRCMYSAEVRYQSRRFPNCHAVAGR